MMIVHTHSREPKGERVADARQSLGSKSGDLFKSAIVRRSLELLQCVEAKLVVKPCGQAIADARHRREEPDRVAVASKPL